MRLPVGAILTHYRMPVPCDERLVLDAEFDNLTLDPQMPIAVAIFLHFVQVDQEFLFAHLRHRM